jgi:hypothetical protein
MVKVLKTLVGAVVAAACAFAGSAAAQLSTTNGILSVSIANTGAGLGQFTINTGASHPLPNQTVFYPIGTSNITLRDNTAQVIYANGGGSTGIAPYTFQSLQTAPCAGVVVAIASGFRTTYTCPNWTVVQDVVIAGTTLTDTNVRQTVTVTNTSAVPRSYGVRYMWDWQIAGNDASIFRTRNPDGSFTSTFFAVAPPSFQAFEEVDNATTPTLSVFGTVMGGTLNPPPTPPDRLVYAQWGTSYNSPWDFAVTGSGGDSSTVHYWGYVTPLTLAAGASASYTEYVSTNPSAVGVGPSAPSTNVPVPTLSQWAMLLLAGLLGLFGLRAARRR